MNLSKRWRASCGPGPASGWYCTVEAGTSRSTSPSTVQYHPEAGPGPHDALHLFDRFLERLAVPS